MRPLLQPVLALALLAFARAGDVEDLGATEQEYESIVREWEAEWDKAPAGESATQLGLSLQALGVVERQEGKPNEALEHLTRACTLLEEHAPELLPDAREALAMTLQDLGWLREGPGGSEGSESLLRKVLEARGDGPDRPNALDHLALNLLAQGRYPEVKPLLDEALSLTPDDDPVSRARRLGYQARLLHTLGNHARAAEILDDALQIPFEDPELRLTLRSERALARLRLGDREGARGDFEAAADEAWALYGDTAPFRVMPYENNLAALALDEGDTEGAGEIYRNVLGVLEDHLGAEHPGLIGPLNNLGVVLQQLEDYDAAEEALGRAAALQAEHLPEIHLRVAETARNLARNSILRESPDADERIDQATRIGLALLDELVHTGTERERLNFLERFDLVSLTCSTGDPGRIANLLLASKSRLFDALLHPGTNQNIPTWGEVQRTLPAEGAFIDACQFVDVRQPEVLRFGAVILLPEGPPRWVPLGTGSDLSQWLRAFRKRLDWNATKAVGKEARAPALTMRTILRALDEEFWEPLGSVLPDGVRHLAFSPDGALHFLPLPALLDERQQPLCRRFLQLTSVSSGRDLLASPSSRRLDSAPWEVLTIDDFPTAPRRVAGDPLRALLSTLQPLPGTREEARRLRAIAPRGSRFLDNEKVVESALTRLKPGLGVIHFGCHAFSLADPVRPASAIDFDQGDQDLLRSGGIVLYHGAQQAVSDGPDPSSDDLLFPADIARLDLSGTRLVTLSSCESGIGTPVSGEGLLGLRRAFALAGADEVMVALWPVADDSTPRFMDRFYRLALASDRPAQALWQAQAEELSEAGNEADFEMAVLRYAPFTLSQSGPLRSGDPISAAPAPRNSRPPLHWLAALPLLLFVATRAVRRKPRKPAQ